MKHIVKMTLGFIIIMFTLASCDKDVALPKSIEIFKGFYLYGDATPFTGMDNNGIAAAGGTVDQGNKFIRLKSGKITLSYEDNSTKTQLNSTIYGVDGSGALKKDAAAINFTQAAGEYLIRFDVKAGTISYTKINGWGLIGSATPGGWSDDTNMTLASYENGIYTYTCDLALTGGNEIKFRANDGWDINLGGEKSGMSFGGSNIRISESGNYSVKLILGTKFTYEIVKK